MLYRQINQWALLSVLGSLAITFDAMLSIEASETSEAPDNPVEKGSFHTYNKISNPLSITVTLGLQCADDEQDIALRCLRLLKDNAILVGLSTPAHFYSGLTLVKFTYTRKSGDGVTLLCVTLTLKEVISVAPYAAEHGLSGQQVWNPGSADREDRGQVPVEIFVV